MWRLVRFVAAWWDQCQVSGAKCYGYLTLDTLTLCYGAVTTKAAPLLRPNTSGAYIW